MSDSPQLYNSRVIDNYLKLLQKSYPHIDIPELLRFAGMKSYQVSDSGHWFTQEQINRFYQRLVDLSGEPDIAREAGRYAASTDCLGVLRQYFLGTLGPANSFRLISKNAPRFTRSAIYKSRLLGSRKVEVTVTPNPGVEEKSFQCLNRLGWFEAAIKVFDLQLDTIDHPQCLFHGDPVCRYIISWEKPDVLPWKRARNLSLLALPPLLSIPLFLPQTGASFLLGAGLISSLLALGAAVEEKTRLKSQVSKIQEETDQALSRISTNHDNAVLIDEIGRAISQETHFDAVLERVVEILSKRLDFSRVMVFLACSDRTRLELYVGHGFSKKMIDQVRNISRSIDLSDPKGLIAKTFSEQEPVLVENIDEWRESFSPEGYRLVRKLGAESFLFCPIVCNGSSMGILAAAKNGGAHRPLMQTDLSLIEGVSAYIGIALRNAELLKTLRDNLREIKERDDALERHRRNLEDEVVMRTAQMREALKSAETANRAKSEFLANMSHEIRTPLHGVLGMNELLLESGLNIQQKEFSRQIQGCAETLLQVITDILDFSKIEADKMDLEDVEFDLEWLLKDSIAPFRPKAEGKGLSLELKLSADVPAWIKGDPLRLRQVLSNLVGNAIKFTEKGSVTIVVSSSSEETSHPSLQFMVQDTGIGMSAKQKEAVFESFCQADGSTSRRYGGSGLGTTICRKLVELMGGRIDCESSLDEGSTFWFDIPLRPAPVPTGREEADGAGGFCLTEGSGRILIVEDNPVNREIIRLHLEGAGYTVVIAPEGGEAISRLRSQPVDLVLMDVQMPGMDGYETTRRIRRGEGGPSNALIPVVALTANATAMDRQRCLDVGMNDVIVKPVRKRDFLAKVHRYLIQPGEGDPQQVAVIIPESVTEPLVFEDALEEFGADGKILRELVSLFLRDTKETLDRIECARKAGDMALISALAHGIKGTAGLLFALPLSRVARALEESASASQVTEMDQDFENVKVEFQRLQKCWQKWEN